MYREVEVGPGNRADYRTTKDQRRSRQSLSIPPIKDRLLTSYLPGLCYYYIETLPLGILKS